jgi:eukaryotic-like serine/threonine-protein kinase
VRSRKKWTLMALTLAAGIVLGRYELLGPIAKGGMAEVWAARLHGSRGFQRIVAVKTIATDTLADTRLEQMFHEEASLASRIQHPNVAATLDLGDQAGTLYMAMEWVDGEPLTVVFDHARRSTGIPLEIAVNLIGQACQGLHAAHESVDEDGAPLGIVHRDISPHNVMVTYAGIVKLVDFGIAKATNMVTGLTEAGEVKGKFAYMAPEQALGQAIDRRTDLFALGILLYLLTTGRHPHKASSPAETIYRLCNDPPAIPSELVSGYPPELEKVVLKALSKDKNDRFAHARELLEALARVVPWAFRAGFETTVAAYLEQLLGERSSESRARLRRAQRALDGLSKEATTASSASDPPSVSSLRALVVDATIQNPPAAAAAETHRTELSSSSSSLRPVPQGRWRWQRQVRPALLMLAVALSAGLIARRLPLWANPHARVPASAPGAIAAPVPLPAILPPPTPPASASTAPVKPARAAPGPLAANPRSNSARQRPRLAPRSQSAASALPVVSSTPAPNAGAAVGPRDPLEKRK